MNKKILAVAIAGALSAPSAFAATDTSGMQYTSASEGFYGSLRVRFNSGGHDNAAGDIQNSSSRVGVRGSLDLGGGLEGFYIWEQGVSVEDGGSNSTRLGHVGLRGGFGSIMVGSGWTELYNMTYGTTDVANHHSGSLVYNDLAPGRANSMIQYLSPDLNGFQAAVAVRMDNNVGSENVYVNWANRADGVDHSSATTVAPTSGAVGAVVDNGTAYAVITPIAGGTPTHAVFQRAVKDENDIDQYLLSAKYEVQGFTAAVGYSNLIEYQGGDEDWTGLVYRLGYSQDNWYLNGWYGSDNSKKAAGHDKDQERLSLAGGVAVGKVNLYAVYEASEMTPTPGGKVEDEYTTVGVQYNLGARSRVWVEYAGEDLDSNENTGDFISIGLRHDF